MKLEILAVAALIASGFLATEGFAQATDANYEQPEPGPEPDEFADYTDPSIDTETLDTPEEILEMLAEDSESEGPEVDGEMIPMMAQTRDAWLTRNQ
tara:strand:+ start:503 stop:793 length:291 start_codon:yes stop_codon:yes gene_type:complete